MPSTYPGYRMKLTYWTALAACALANTAVAAQNSAPGARAGRVVLHSPHYDVPPPVWESFSCPAQVLHLYGVEDSVQSTKDISRLAVRARTHPSSRSVEPDRPLGGVLLRLSHRLDAGSQQELPSKAPFVVGTDSRGEAELVVEAGVYRIEVGSVGYSGGDGLIRVRPGATDSLLMYLDQVVLCN